MKQLYLIVERVTRVFLTNHRALCHGLQAFVIDVHGTKYHVAFS